MSVGSTVGQIIELEGYLMTNREIDGTSLQELQQRFATAPSKPVRVDVHFDAKRKQLNLSGDLSLTLLLKRFPGTENGAEADEAWMGQYFYPSAAGDGFLTIAPSPEINDEIEIKYTSSRELIILQCRITRIEY